MKGFPTLFMFFDLTAMICSYMYVYVHQRIRVTKPDHFCQYLRTKSLSAWNELTEMY